MPNFDPYDLPGDARNPYAPPEAALGRRGEMFLPGGSLVEPFSIGAVWNMAWGIFKERMWLVIGLVIAANAISFAFQFIINVLPGSMQGQGNPDAGVVILLLVVFLLAAAASIWLTLGETIALIKIARGQDAAIGDLFTGGRFIWSFIVASVLFVVCVYGAIGIMMIPVGLLAYLAEKAAAGAAAPILIIGLILVVIVAMIAAVRLYFYSFALVDRGLGAVDSLKYAAKITKGHTLSLVGFMIVTSFVGGSGALACLVGLIFTIPLSMLMYACAYVILSNQPEVAFLKTPGSDFVEL